MENEDDILLTLRNEMRCSSLHQHAAGVLYKNGNMQEAADCYIEIIDINPDDAVAHENLGIIINATKGNPDKAIKHLTKAIRLNPNGAGAFYNRGNSYSSIGDLDRAISDYTQAIRLKPDYAWAFYNRGLSYKKKGDYTRAFSDFSKAYRLDPTDRQAKNQLDELHFMGY